VGSGVRFPPGIRNLQEDRLPFIMAAFCRHM
jgi:hypothetical protein